MQKKAEAQQFPNQPESLDDDAEGKLFSIRRLSLSITREKKKNRQRNFLRKYENNFFF